MAIRTTRLRHTGGARVALAIALMACLGLLGLALPAGAAEVPLREDSVNESVYLIHGYDKGPYAIDPMPDGYDCNSWWKPARTAMTSWRWTEKKLITYGYYATDTNCDVKYKDESYAGDRNTPLADIAKHLAWNIYNEHSSKGQSVDVMAYSMGGLIIRSALSEVSKGNSSFPPYLYVEDVVTLGTPHGGTRAGAMCATAWFGFRQCDEMQSDSAFLRNQVENPQSAQGTDWTLVGSDFDYVVPAWSATGMAAAHKVVFDVGGGITHQLLYRVTEGSYGMRFINKSGTRWQHTDNGASPVRVAGNALHWQGAW